MQVTQTHVRRDGSTYRTVWTKTDWFCVGCGKQSVWEDDCDDYYMGTGFCCAACGANFRHPDGSDSSADQKFLAVAAPPSEDTATPARKEE